MPAIKKYFIFVLLFIAACEVNAQFNNFKKLAVKDGLPQSDIYAITQDSRDYLWFASGGGVAMFDGINFKNFTKRNGLAGNLVRSLFEDSRGNIWFGTNEGVCYYDGLKFHKLNNKNLKGTFALCFAEDRNHFLYIGTDDGGLNILKFTNDSLEIFNLNEDNGLSSNSIFDIAIDAEQRVWLATFGGGLDMVSFTNKKFKTIVFRGYSHLPSDVLLSVAIKGDDLWLGSQDAGAFKFSIRKLVSNNSTPPEIYNTQNSLNSNYIWDILPAKDGKVWLASMENGITRLENSGSKNKNTSFTKNNGLSDNQIFCLYEDKQQNVWIGTNGNGVNMLSGDHFSHYNTASGLLSDKIQSIAQDSTGTYWLASSGGGLSAITFTGNGPEIKNYIDEKGLTNFISSVSAGKANNKNIWFATDNNGIVKFTGSKFYNFTEKDGLISDHVYSIYVDSKGIVWCGTADGISRYDGSKFLNTSTDKMKMQNEGVKAIVEDQAGNIWFGTSGGLARYSGDGQLRTFDEVEGLKNKDINALTASSAGDIFIGTNTGGLYRYNHLKNDSNSIEFVADDSLLLSNSIRSVVYLNDSMLIAGTFKGFDRIYLNRAQKIIKVKHYTIKDGFLGLECNDNAILLDRDHNIWFGTVSGITRYAPSLDNKTIWVPKVYITDVQIAFKDVNWEKKQGGKKAWFNVPKELILPYDQNNLAFKFHANDFTASDNVLYKFILQGRDKDWSPPRKKTEEEFSGLEPGSYTLKVMAQSQDGEWSQPVSYSFTITPPWYKTTSFYVFVVLALILLVYAYIKWREKKLVHEKKILEDTVKERTHEVEVQKEHLAEKNKEITDSITYAQGIQQAMLPPMSDICGAWKDLFIFFQPKDIVSGDFYWFQQINKDEFLIACADCTGHGVPGGFMSMICSDRLHDAAKETLEPALILKKTNNGVKTSLRQQIDFDGKSKDGMEICLLKVNTASRSVSYSGAHRSLWLVDGETRQLTEIKATKASIASFTEFNFEYDQTDLLLKKGDLLYASSDGFPDQFGGTDGKKYMSRNLKNLIVSNCDLPMAEQHLLFKNEINTWMGIYEQVDDLLVIGIRL